MLGFQLNTLDKDELALIEPLIARQREMGRRMADHLSPVDKRIQDFVDSYLSDVDIHPQIPRRTLVLDQPGLARELSLPRARPG